MRRSPGLCLLLVSGILSAGGPPVPGAERKTKEDAAQLADPLAYGADRVEVTVDGNLRRRYRVWGDWKAEVAAWLKQAQDNAAARGTPARKLKVGCVLLKDATITATDLKGDDGEALTATYTTPPAFADAMKTRGLPEYADFMYAFSGGELEVEWVVETLEGLHWSGPGSGWGCQPRAVGDQVLKGLEQHREADVAMWMFCAGKPTTLNAKDPKRQVRAPPHGVSYTQWAIHGGFSLVLSAPDVGLMVHEFNHRYLDNLPGIEGVHLTMFHGLAGLGYGEADCGYPHLLNTYRSVYQHIVRRDMWRRFTLKSDVNHTRKEPFSGRAYAWDDVKHDCWFTLPELSNASLAKLTGIPSFEMEAPKGHPGRLYKAATADRDRILSPRLDASSLEDKALNNHIAVHRESCAVLKTATGHWLFVKPDVADLYVDMERLSGRGTAPLPVYGYVNEGILPLLVIRAPAGLDVPSNERAYFGRKP